MTSLDGPAASDGPSAPEAPGITHVHGDHIAVTAGATAGGVELLRYVYRPEAAWEAPKPYVHPLRTLRGDVVTDYRPNDHRWHKGLQMTASHLSGQNLWGGNTYVHGEGYLPLPDRIGSMRHVDFDEVSAEGGRAVIAERLTWHPNDGAHWADELRRIEIQDIAPATGSWALTWSSTITNRRDEPLAFGSPTSHGRELAGYTGLFWRGPRSFRDGRVFAPHDEGPGLMGRPSPWLAYTGEHDGADGHATLVFVHAPENGREDAHPSHWFVRNAPFAAVAPSFAFYDDLVLAPGDTLTRRYRIVVADGAWSREAVARHLEDRPW